MHRPYDPPTRLAFVFGFLLGIAVTLLSTLPVGWGGF